MTLRLKFCLLCFVSVALRLSFAEDEHVVVLNKDNFDSVIQQGNAVVEFYAPWCGHCKKLAPEYEKAAKKLKEQGSSVTLANCDTTKEENKPLMKKYGVTGFPTLKLFRNGSIDDPEDYEGPRDAEGIVKALNKAFGPPSTYFDKKEDLKKFDDSKDMTMVGIFTGEDSKAFQVYLKVCEKLRKEMIEIGHTFKPEIVPLCEGDSEECKGPFLAILNSPEVNLTKYEGPFEEELVYKWVTKTITPRLLELDQARPRVMKLFQEAFKKPEPRLIGYSIEARADTPAFKEALIKADESDDSFNVLYIDPKNNEKAAAFFGLKEGDYPAVVLHEHSVEKKYIKKNCLPSDVPGFIAKWKAGELTASVKSEEIPKDNSGPVKVVVAKEYNSFMDSGKDIFIEFYAPWCGHCKKLAPIYEDLGKHYQEREDIDIAKMDATVNDIPDPRVKVKGFPTLKYFKKDGEILDYTGDRSLKDLINFVDKALGIAPKDPMPEKDSAEETKDEKVPKKEDKKDDKKEAKKEDKEEVKKDEL
eukprot:g5342.t1